MKIDGVDVGEPSGWQSGRGDRCCVLSKGALCNGQARSCVDPGKYISNAALLNRPDGKAGYNAVWWS